MFKLKKTHLPKAPAFRMADDQLMLMLPSHASSTLYPENKICDYKIHFQQRWTWLLQPTRCQQNNPLFLTDD